MACLFCRKKIGPLRKLVDANFCCADHRKKYRAHSARSLREAEDLYGSGDEWTERWRLYTTNKPQNKHASHSQGSVFVVAVAVAFLLFAVSRGPAGGAPPTNRSAGEPSHGSESGGGLQRRIGEVIETHAPVTIRETFHTGLSQWDSEPGQVSRESKWGDWSFDGGYIRPGSLRLWKNSQSLANYDLEFVGHVEKRSMDWAFRAVDFKNYYATKLTVASEGKSGYSNAGLVRYAVIDGKERDRVELPLPITLDRDTDYRVKVSIRGSRFLTSIDGQLVSSWIDSRISRGGVGLFSDAGESSAFKWLSVSERDSFWGRLASHFSLITFPALPPDAALSR